MTIYSDGEILYIPYDSYMRMYKHKGEIHGLFNQHFEKICKSDDPKVINKEIKKLTGKLLEQAELIRRTSCKRESLIE